MKANDLAVKFISLCPSIDLSDPEKDKKMIEGINFIYNDMIDEFTKQVEARNVSSVEGLFGIFQDLLAKWNSLCTRLEKFFGFPVLKKDVGFEMVIKTQEQSDIEDLGHISENTLFLKDSYSQFKERQNAKSHR